MTAANVTLKNGGDAPGAAVTTTMLTLHELAGTDFIAFYELVAACRDRDHALFGGTASTLQAYAMVESVDGSGRASIHDAVRDIVLSAVTGEDLGLSLQSPLE